MLDLLFEKYKSKVQFLVVYVMEAHAKQEWPLGTTRSSIGQHKTIEERIAAANAYRTKNITLLNFPFVVDSPVTAMDDISREEIAKTISKDLNNQYIGLLLPTERDHFSDELGSNQNKKIKYITAFSTYDNASEHMVQQANNFGINTNEFKNGVVGYGEDFFNQFSGISKEI